MKNLVVGFDFDQTLADSSQGIVDCLKAVADIQNVEIEERILYQLAISGRPLRDTLSQFLPDHDIEIGVETFMQVYPKVGVQGTSLFPGVIELFTKLKKERALIFILSSKTHSNLILTLDYLQLRADQAIGSLDYNGKVKYIRDLELDIYVGDQFSDMSAAAESGCRGILVNNFSESETSIPLHARFRSVNEMQQNFSSLLYI
jgi:phosphoglycolate phosphatase-like HAD superfamily hydrolase